jgi:hypothetical protein
MLSDSYLKDLIDDHFGRLPETLESMLPCGNIYWLGWLMRLSLMIVSRSSVKAVGMSDTSVCVSLVAAVPERE